MQIEKIGRRSYIVGSSYGHREAIKAAGAKWDADRKQWWMSKADAAEALVASLSEASTPAPTPADKSDTDDQVVAARCTYAGQSYYVAGRVIQGRTHWDDKVDYIATRDGQRLMLVRRDSNTFWAPAADVVIDKRYDKPQTIGGLKRYAERLRKTGDTPELDAARRRGWDGKIGSSSYYSSGAFDEIDQ